MDDLIERLAREAGGVRTVQPGGGELIAFHPVDLQRLVAAVAEGCCAAVDEALDSANPEPFGPDEIKRLIRAKFKEPS